MVVFLIPHRLLLYIINLLWIWWSMAVVVLQILLRLRPMFPMVRVLILINGQVLPLMVRLLLFAVTAAGPYQVTVTDQNLCVASSSVQIFDPYLPSIVASKTAICEGESIQLSVNASSATAYHWSSNTGGTTSATLIFVPSGTFCIVCSYCDKPQWLHCNSCQ